LTACEPVKNGQLFHGKKTLISNDYGRVLMYSTKNLSPKKHWIRKGENKVG